MPSKPAGLPKPEGPASLPSIPDAQQEDFSHLDANIDRARICEGCGREGRVVSNQWGVNVHCGPCKRHWPIANSPLKPESPAALPRGISKRTSVEPDWNVAFEDDIDLGE